MSTGAAAAPGRSGEVAWRRTHGGRLLHALRLAGDGPPRSGHALCGARVELDLRHAPPEEEERAGRSRCQRCDALVAGRSAQLPEAEPGMLF